ncbi:WD40 repeat-like protein, partial [Cladochytrium replicatum]
MAASLAHSIQHRERVGGFRHEQRGLHPAHLSRLTLSQVLNGHNGCVNALNWYVRNRDGSLLASGSDDLHVCVHKFSTAGVSPLLARIPTGHRGNIFSVKVYTNDTIACCARDGHVRILDLNIATKDGALRSVYTCHKDAVKRIVTDPRSDSVFLSCSEDGTVRQFDLRVPHQCNHAQQICPPPLVDYSSNSELTALSLNRINPNYFAIGGTDPQVLVHDRRMPSRAVRKFHQPAEETGYARRRTDSHVTAVQFAQTNGRELLGSWGSGYVQLFDFERDELEQEAREKQRAMRRVWLGNSDTASLGALDQIISQVREHFVHSSWDDARGDSSDENENEDDGSDSGDDEEEGYDHDTSSTNERNLSEKRRQAVNICYPRRRFVGHCNVMTTKDVTFLGARDEYVASGSDDGSLIIFDKFTGRVLQVLRADGEVCNVIQAHPSYPVLAASGIDDTIKIFEPV